MRLQLRLMGCIAALLLASQLFGAIEASACILGPYSEAEALRDAGAVFVGKVLDITDSPEAQPQTGAGCVEHTNHFQVITSWKGLDYTLDSLDVYNVTCDHPSSDCDFLVSTFQRGETYLVFATIQSNGRLKAVVFGYTSLASNTADKIKALGPGQIPGQVPVHIVGMPATGEPTNYYNWLCVFALVSISGGVVLRHLTTRKVELI